MGTDKRTIYGIVCRRRTESIPCDRFICHRSARANHTKGHTGLSKQTVSTVIRVLKEEGLVSLQAGKSDRCEKKVYLTRKGTLYAAEVLSPLHTLEERVFDIMSAEHMKQMTDTITRFNIVFEREIEKQANEHRT